MAQALNVSVVQKQLQRCLHFPPGIQDWVTDLGNVGEVKAALWAFFLSFKTGVVITTTMHPIVLYTIYPLHVLNLEGQNSVAPKYYTMIIGVSSFLLYVGGMVHMHLRWEIFHGRESGTG